MGERASIFDNFIEQFPIIKHLDCWLECYECGEEEEEEEEAAAAAAAEEEEEEEEEEAEAEAQEQGGGESS